MSVLVIGSSPRDGAALKGLFPKLENEFHQVSTCDEAITLLETIEVSVVVWTAEPIEGDCERLLDFLTRLAERPVLVMTSQFTDDRIWAEVLSSGGFGALRRTSIAGA